MRSSPHQQAAHTGLVRRFAGFGSQVELRLWPQPGRTAAAALALARTKLFLRMAEARLSRFRPESEISRLNDAAGRPVRVSRLTFRAVHAALVAARATDGLFDPTVQRALLAAGYDRSFEQLPRTAHGPEVLMLPVTGRYGEVNLDPATGSVQLPAGVGLDLGGIAKGWLADIVLRRLARHGAALVDIGGDLALSPLPGTERWEVEVGDPFDDLGTLGVLRPRGGGVATSGVRRRRWRQGCTWRHHLIDPRTGRPAETNLVAVTVTAPSATIAEVAAKATLLLGLKDGGKALTLRDELGGVLVTDGGVALAVGGVDWTPASAGEPWLE